MKPARLKKSNMLAIFSRLVSTLGSPLWRFWGEIQHCARCQWATSLTEANGDAVSQSNCQFKQIDFFNRACFITHFRRTALEREKAIPHWSVASEFWFGSRKSWNLSENVARYRPHSGAAAMSLRHIRRHGNGHLLLATSCVSWAFYGSYDDYSLVTRMAITLKQKIIFQICLLFYIMYIFINSNMACILYWKCLKISSSNVWWTEKTY